MEITIYDSAKQTTHDPALPATFSSSAFYDRAMLGVFPYFALLSAEDAQEVAALLARGYSERLREFMPTSFALVTNFNRFNGDQPERVLWMSGDSVKRLTEHHDLYKLNFSEETVSPKE